MGIEIEEFVIRIIAPYITFLNVHQLERQGVDILSKVKELEEVNQTLRSRVQIPLYMI